MYCSAVITLLQEVDELSTLISSRYSKKELQVSSIGDLRPRVQFPRVEEAKFSFWKEYGTQARLSPYCLFIVSFETYLLFQQHPRPSAEVLRKQQ